MDENKLHALGGLVDEIDAAGPMDPEQMAQQQQEVQQQTNDEREAQEWGATVYMIGAALSMLAPELRQVYTQEACFDWGRAMVPVSQKYGWSGPGNVPELGLVMASAQLVVPTYFIIKGRLTAPPVEAEKDSLIGRLKSWWNSRKSKADQPVDEASAPEGADHGR